VIVGAEVSGVGEMVMIGVGVGMVDSCRSCPERKARIPTKPVITKTATTAKTIKTGFWSFED